MQNRCHIVGAGIAGLLTAYHLTKRSPTIQIEIYEAQNQYANNASTYSLAWVNVVYPCKTNDINKQLHYDIVRLESLEKWQDLNEALKADGIEGVLSTEEQAIKIDHQLINSVSVFFDSEQVKKFTEEQERLKIVNHRYKHYELAKSDLLNDFPFLTFLPDSVKILNCPKDQLVNIKNLREGLIHYLQRQRVTFHWESTITSEMMAKDSGITWVVAAANGHLELTKHTQIEKLNYPDSSMADVITCTLVKPLDLKGKVFHFSASAQTPSFHLRNDDDSVDHLKIIVMRQQEKRLALDLCAKQIFNLLQITPINVNCNNQVERPNTLDGMPLVEFGLGQHKNIHVVYGHSLYSNAATLFPEFADQLIKIIQNQNAMANNNLQLFSAKYRFASTQNVSLGRNSMFARSNLESASSSVPTLRLSKL